MFALILYFVFGYFVIQFEKPIKFAVGFSVTTAALSLIFGEELLSVLLFGAMTFAYTAFVYMVVDRFGNGIFAPIGVLVVGALIPVAAALTV